MTGCNIGFCKGTNALEMLEDFIDSADLLTSALGVTIGKDFVPTINACIERLREFVKEANNDKGALKKIRRHIKKTADLNKDGKVNSKDVREIYNLAKTPEGRKELLITFTQILNSFSSLIVEFHRLSLLTLNTTEGIKKEISNINNYLPEENSESKYYTHQFVKYQKVANTENNSDMFTHAPNSPTRAEQAVMSSATTSSPELTLKSKVAFSPS